MGKHLALLVAAFVLVSEGSSSRVTATVNGTMPLVASGDPIIGVVNTNDNDSLTDPQDCKITASASITGTLEINAEQDPDENTSLQYCDETYRGTYVRSVDFIEFDVTRNPPGLFRSIVTLVMSLSSSSTPTFAVGGATGIPPLQAGAAELRNIFGGFRGEGFLCNSGGPKVQIKLDNGITLLFDLQPFPSDDPTHVCAKSVPFEIGFGEFEAHDICFPTDENGNIEMAVEEEEEDPFLIIQLDDLPGCTAARQAAPTASEWGLIFLALALLGGGTWFLSRRRSLAMSLPQP